MKIRYIILILFGTLLFIFVKCNRYNIEHRKESHGILKNKDSLFFVADKITKELEKNKKSKEETINRLNFLLEEKEKNLRIIESNKIKYLQITPVLQIENKKESSNYNTDLYKKLDSIKRKYDSLLIECNKNSRNNQVAE